MAWPGIMLLLVQGGAHGIMSLARGSVHWLNNNSAMRREAC